MRLAASDSCNLVSRTNNSVLIAPRTENPKRYARAEPYSTTSLVRSPSLPWEEKDTTAAVDFWNANRSVWNETVDAFHSVVHEAVPFASSAASRGAGRCRFFHPTNPHAGTAITPATNMAWFLVLHEAIYKPSN